MSGGTTVGRPPVSTVLRRVLRRPYDLYRGCGTRRRCRSMRSTGSGAVRYDDVRAAISTGRPTPVPRRGPVTLAPTRGGPELRVDDHVDSRTTSACGPWWAGSSPPGGGRARAHGGRGDRDRPGPSPRPTASMPWWISPALPRGDHLPHAGRPGRRAPADPPLDDRALERRPAAWTDPEASMPWEPAGPTSSTGREKRRHPGDDMISADRGGDRTGRRAVHR